MSWARSYLRKQGQPTRAQKRALTELWPHWGLRYPHDQCLDLDAAFGFSGPTILEIGFGNGESLVDAARDHPERRYVGIETHVPGLGAALLRIDRAGVENVRIVRGDALLILDKHLDGVLLSEAWIFFPDPWPNTVDAKRRIVRPELAALLARRMSPAGILHVATDVCAYADHVRLVMAAAGWTEAPRHDRHSVTHYERKALEEGRTVTELRYRCPALGQCSPPS